jgi:phytoene dehydrogenase-like protein
MTDRKRTIVIGAGHNGLVCAAYLAKAGRDVVVVEAA